VQELKTGRMRAAPLASLLSEAHQTVLAEIEEAAGGPVR
jgi:hypothetical protein